MNTYRNGDSVNPPENEIPNPTPATALLQNSVQSLPTPPETPQSTGVTYAQIQRHNAATTNEPLDFRMQVPRSDDGTLSDYRSISSNGYVNLPSVNPQLQPNNIVLRNRPQSPETSF